MRLTSDPKNFLTLDLTAGAAVATATEGGRRSLTHRSERYRRRRPRCRRTPRRRRDPPASRERRLQPRPRLASERGDGTPEPLGRRRRHHPHQRRRSRPQLRDGWGAARRSSSPTPAPASIASGKNTETAAETAETAVSPPRAFSRRRQFRDGGGAQLEPLRDGARVIAAGAVVPGRRRRRRERAPRARARRGCGAVRAKKREGDV